MALAYMKNIFKYQLDQVKYDFVITMKALFYFLSSAPPLRGPGCREPSPCLLTLITLSLMVSALRASIPGASSTMIR